MIIAACVTHRQPAADVSDEEECVMFEVAHHGVAAAQLGGPAVPLVVVADGAVADHGQDEGEDPLVVTRGGEMRALLDSTNTYFCSKIWIHAQTFHKKSFFLSIMPALVFLLQNRKCCSQTEICCSDLK